MTDDPQFIWLRCVFEQYFDDWLVSFKQQDGNYFLKQKKIHTTANMYMV